MNVNAAKGIAVKYLLQQFIARENANDLRTYSDKALAALCTRAGYKSSIETIYQHRKSLGIPAQPKRLNALITMGEKNERTKLRKALPATS